LAKGDYLDVCQCAPLVCLEMASVMSDTDSHASSHLSQHSVKEDIRQNEESELFLPSVATTFNDMDETDEEDDSGEAFKYVVNVESLEEIDMSTDMVFGRKAHGQLFSVTLYLARQLEKPYMRPCLIQHQAFRAFSRRLEP